MIKRILKFFKLLVVFKASQFFYLGIKMIS